MANKEAGRERGLGNLDSPCDKAQKRKSLDWRETGGKTQEKGDTQAEIKRKEPIGGRNTR